MRIACPRGGGVDDGRSWSRRIREDVSHRASRANRIIHLPSFAMVDADAAWAWKRTCAGTRTRPAYDRYKSAGFRRAGILETESMAEKTPA